MRHKVIAKINGKFLESDAYEISEPLTHNQMCSRLGVLPETKFEIPPRETKDFLIINEDGSYSLNNAK